MGKLFLLPSSPRRSCPKPLWKGLPQSFSCFFFTFSISLSTGPSTRVYRLAHIPPNLIFKPLTQHAHLGFGKLWSTGSTSLSIKFNWNIATLICLHYIVYGCFHTTRTELSNCDRDLAALKAKNICSMDLFRKKCLPLHTHHPPSSLLAIP